ncbi:MbcA/ParS/Xre antitoxin family protein [Oleiagrimonas sp. C23AA]|uniref:MbcA/ParS/Xre antitoxin family protein n=1 Tax=Oleiagrimonas sp. C23AA TaxID=2719047 RepID=UPI0014223FAB|nr:MbcA/ParS/Xre antitoxin family protein [Oleiagrimonas sp. C23AA]NII10642.1 DUF2384 domain-containing protein [Oleiagrimonas sp. C23AA]
MSGVSVQTASAPLGDMAPAALRTFFALAERWQLDEAQQRRLLGEPSVAAFKRWKRRSDGLSGADAPSRDTLERISYLLGIYKDLQILFPEAERADAWVHKPNQAAPFGGQSALDRMLSGHVVDLYEVRRYLDAQRGGWG